MHVQYVLILALPSIFVAFLNETITQRDIYFHFLPIKNVRTKIVQGKGSRDTSDGSKRLITKSILAFSHDLLAK